MGTVTTDRRVAVVIPSLTGRVDAVLASVARQVPRPDEVEVVVGIRPNGRARNLGAARTTAPILVFVDDDAVLTGDRVLADLVAPLGSDATIGAAGAAKLLPPGSSRFQRRVAREVPRIEHPVVDHVVESNPPLGRHGYTDVTTTCCAMPRAVFDECGGFDDDLVRGVDSELFYRVRTAGYRLVLAPHASVHHPAPATLSALLAKHFLYGAGYAGTVQRHPALAAGRFLRTPAHTVAYLLARTALLVPNMVIPYSHAAPSWRPGFRPLKALTSYAAALGYAYGWYRYPYRRKPDA
ncbi:MAG TPA: glycosyltransferase [Acidimicrobiales bacterium]|nr:glycosyltransferase [Acidimicrobiales bacterium]